jgi:hypothetical protein
MIAKAAKPNSIALFLRVHSGCCIDRAFRRTIISGLAETKVTIRSSNRRGYLQFHSASERIRHDVSVVNPVLRELLTCSGRRGFAQVGRSFGGASSPPTLTTKAIAS